MHLCKHNITNIDMMNLWFTKYIYSRSKIPNAVIKCIHVFCSKLRLKSGPCSVRIDELNVPAFSFWATTTSNDRMYMNLTETTASLFPKQKSSEVCVLRRHENLKIPWSYV